MVGFNKQAKEVNNMERKELVKKIIELRNQKMTWRDIGLKCEISTSTVIRLGKMLKKAGLIINEPVNRKTDQQLIEELKKEKA